MKRFISFILVIILTLSFIACDNDEVIDNGSTESTDVSAEPIDFQTGYARVDITPTTLPMEFDGSNPARSVNENIYATCIAVSDGETQVMLISLDLIGIPGTFIKTVKSYIRKEMELMSNQVFMFATHTHSAPNLTIDDPSINAWSREIAEKISKCAAEAMADLAPTEISIAREQTENMTFVRRYKMSDGSYKGIWSANPNNTYVEHESEADGEVQVMRFIRENAKDIVLVNWQSHPANAIGFNGTAISSDFVDFARRTVEAAHDVNFIYFSGALGNLVISSSITGETKYTSYRQLGNALGEVINKILDGEMEKVSTGKIKVTHYDKKCMIAQDDEKTYQNAILVTRVANPDGAYKKYGFASVFEARAVVQRHDLGDSADVSLAALSFGDVSFACAPYEMFDTNGMEIKAATPYKMTFVCSLFGGNHGGYDYIPSALAYTHGEYEVYRSYFVAGTGEELANSLVDLLNQNKAK